MLSVHARRPIRLLNLLVQNVTEAHTNKKLLLQRKIGVRPSTLLARLYRTKTLLGRTKLIGFTFMTA